MSTLTDDDLTALLTQLADEYDVPAHGPAEVVTALEEEPAATPVVRRRWVQLSAAASVLVLVVVAVAVGGGSTATDTTAALKRTSGDVNEFTGAGGGVGAGTAVGAGGAVAPAAPGGTGGGSTGGTTGGTAMSSLDGAQQSGSRPAPQAAAGRALPAANVVPPAAPLTGAVGAPAPDGAEGRVVKTGSIALVAKDRQVSRVLSAVQRAAKAHGGYVAASTSNEYGDTPSGEVTLRVPVTRFEDLVAKVRSLDAEVRTATTAGKDVTAQYADIETQLRTLRATRERFLIILSRTRTISEILSVQQRVDGVTGQIDRLEGSRKLLASQSELSTLTVSVSEKDDPVVAVEARRSGLSEALHDAKDGFVTGVEALIRHSGRALLWLICLAVLLAAGRVAWKVARRRLV